jgi:hypothetical protein
MNGLIPLTNLCWYIVCVKRRKFFKKIVDKSEKINLDDYILHEVINIKAYSWSKCPKFYKKRLQKTISDFYYIYYFMITMDWCMIITITMSC